MLHYLHKIIRSMSILFVIYSGALSIGGHLLLFNIHINLIIAVLISAITTYPAIHSISK